MFSKSATRLACATALLVSPWLTSGSHAQTLTLGTALQRALAASPRLTAAERDVGIATGQRIQAGALINPEISYEQDNSFGSGIYRGTKSAETTLQISQAFELFGKRDARDRRGPGRRRDGDDPAQGRPAGDAVGDRDRVPERAGAAAADPDPRRTGRRHRQDHATAAATRRGGRLLAGRDGPGGGSVRTGKGRPRACERGAGERAARASGLDGRHGTEVCDGLRTAGRDRAAADVPGGGCGNRRESATGALDCGLRAAQRRTVAGAIEALSGRTARGGVAPFQRDQ